MQRYWRTLIYSIAVSLGLAVGTAQAQDKVDKLPVQQPVQQSVIVDNGASPLSDWYVQAGAVVLRRSHGSHAALVTNPAGTTVIGSADDLNSGYTGGPDITVGFKASDDTDLALRYFGVYNWNGNGFVAGPGNVGGAGVIGSNLQVNYRSSMQSVEGIMRKWITPEFAFLGNVRYINWHESLNGTFNVGGPGGPVGSGTVLTNNNMFGTQMGFEWQRALTGRLTLDVVGKTGIFGNEAYVRGTTGIGGLNATVSRSVGRLAFMHEFAIVTKFQLTEHISLNAGGTMMLLQHAALAPEQISGLNFAGGGASVNARPNVFLFGGLFGAEIRW